MAGFGTIGSEISIGFLARLFRSGVVLTVSARAQHLPRAAVTDDDELDEGMNEMLAVADAGGLSIVWVDPIVGLCKFHQGAAGSWTPKPNRARAAPLRSFNQEDSRPGRRRSQFSALFRSASCGKRVRPMRQGILLGASRRERDG